MHFLATKLGGFLVDAVLDWIAGQVADEAKKRQFLARHKAKWKKLAANLVNAQTKEDRENAARDITRNSF
jgi:hypothetical protein